MSIHLPSELYDPGTPVGQVRLLIDDTDDSAPIFHDSELDTFLTLNGGSVLRAAAQALLLIAGSEVRLGKKITSQDLATDGPAVAAELRAQAAALRTQADQLDAAAPEASIFEVVEYPYGHSPTPELTEPTW